MRVTNKIINDPRVTYLPYEYKRIKNKLSDAEWENTPDALFLKKEFDRIRKLMKSGVTHEPNF